MMITARRGIMKRGVNIKLALWWDKFLREGDEVFEFDGGVVGKIDRTKIALITDRPGGQPIYEIPADAVEWQ